MLTENVAEFTAIVLAMRAWHTAGTVPNPARGITAKADNTIWEIPYGSYGNPAGSIRLKQNNFEATHVTVAGVFTVFDYNHIWPGELDSAKIDAALSCTDLTKVHTSRAIIIMMLSESARSNLVAKYVGKVLGGKKLSKENFTTVTALTKEYEHTQKHAGRGIVPGAGWSPLTLADHKTYNKHLADNVKNVVNRADEIDSLIGALA